MEKKGPIWLIVIAVLGILSLFILYNAMKNIEEDRTLNYDLFKSQIRSLGFQVESAGEVEQPFFSVRGRVLKITNQSVQVFEFKDAEQAEKEALEISANGTIIGKTVIDWVVPPHFYKQGRLIVVYVGNQSETLALLNKLLGTQIAGEDSIIIKSGICRNRCGDGICQQIACMAEGCPCPESIDTCPKDCKPNSPFN